MAKASQTSQTSNKLSPNHVRVMRSLLGKARLPSSQDYHPLVVPSPTGQSLFGNDNTTIPAETGEYIIPKAVVQRKGTQFFDNLVKKTLSEVMPPDQADQGGEGTPDTGYAKGGEVGGWSEPPSLNQDLGPGGNPSSWAGGRNWQDYAGDYFNRPTLWGVNAFGNPNQYTSFGYNPFGMSSNWPGSTMIPTNWDRQGYPFAVPVWNPTAWANASDPVGLQHAGQHVNTGK